MTLKTPLRLMILHLEHIFLTDDLTFMTDSRILSIAYRLPKKTRE